MSKTVESLAAAALDLPSDQRLALAHRILTSVEPASSPALEEEWDAEIRDRIERLDSGALRAMSASDAFAAVDRAIRQ